ncbi:MAG: 30S ribosomal protein S9 [Chloroflexi bacterium]|nr:30S ribosomal protein S9 [Chloroflexota bacterium]
MVTQAEPQAQYFYGTGRRKSAIAKVRIYPDDGTAIIVNDKPMEEYFNWLPWQSTVREPFATSGTVGRFRVMAKVTGGGVNAQAEAIRHGISRALVVFDPNLKSSLRRAGFITRDARVKESKKYGLKRARRAPQYTKR